VIDAASVPVPKFATSDEQILARLLTAGDDYEILAAIRQEHEAAFCEAARIAQVNVARIGVLSEGPGKTRVQVEGRPLPLYNRSYVHGGNDERP
jgi:thiamine-monophosphate kinase